VLLEDIGVNSVSFSKATHVVKAMLGKCELYVPCIGNEQALHIKHVVTEFFGSPVEDNVACVTC
jgi:hypothetical protein